MAWGIWHGMMQTYGFCRIYDAKASARAAARARVDLALCFAWFSAAVLLSPMRFRTLFELYYESGGPVIASAAVAGDSHGGGGRAGTGDNCLLVAPVERLARGRGASPVKMMLLVSSIGFWWYCNNGVQNILVGIALFEVFHDVQYLAIVWIYNRTPRRARQEYPWIHALCFSTQWSADRSLRWLGPGLRSNWLNAIRHYRRMDSARSNRHRDRLGAVAFLLRRIHLEGPRNTNADDAWNRGSWGSCLGITPALAGVDSAQLAVGGAGDSIWSALCHATGWSRRATDRANGEGGGSSAAGSHRHSSITARPCTRRDASRRQSADMNSRSAAIRRLAEAEFYLGVAWKDLADRWSEIAEESRAGSRPRTLRALAPAGSEERMANANRIWPVSSFRKGLRG